MAKLNIEALDALKITLQILVPDFTETDIDCFVIVNPLYFAPSGIGGLVGINANNDQEIYGVKVNAQVNITLQAQSREEINNALATVSGALTGAEKKNLKQQGILEISLEKIGDLLSHNRGQQTYMSIDLIFKLLFEYLKEPEIGDDIIQEIPTSVGLT